MRSLRDVRGRTEGRTTDARAVDIINGGQGSSRARAQLALHMESRSRWQLVSPWKLWFAATITYKDIWAASLGEELPCQREPSNRSDRFAVAVLKLERLWAIFPERYRAFALCTSASLDVMSRDHGDILMTFRKGVWKSHVL